MAKKNEKKPAGSNNHSLLKTSLGLVLGAASAYYLYGTNEGKKKRKQFKDWSLQAKNDVLEQIENTKVITEKKYHDLVDRTVKKYSAGKDIDKEEINEIILALRSHWNVIKSEVKNVTGTVAKKLAGETANKKIAKKRKIK